MFLKNLKIELPCDPAIPLLGIYPEKTIIQKDTYTPMFTAALFTVARTWKQPKCPSTEERIKILYLSLTFNILIIMCLGVGLLELSCLILSVLSGLGCLFPLPG